MTTNQEIKLGAVLSYLRIAVSAVITLVYTPFMMRTLGQSEYGLYNTVASTVSSLNILSLGFGSSYVRFYTKYAAQKDEKQVNQLNGMFMTIFLLIGLIALICGEFLSFNLELVFSRGLTPGEYSKARILMQLLTINLAISFPCSVFSSIITAHERFVFQKMRLLIQHIVSPLVCVPLLLLGYASIGMVCSTVIINLIIDACNAHFVFTKLKVKFDFSHFDLHVFKDIAIYSLFIAINMIVDLINLNVDKILLGRFRGTVSVAVYSAGFTLYSYFTSFSTAISGVYIPRIHKIWNDVRLPLEERLHRMSEIFTRIGKIQFVIQFLLCSGLIIFGKWFILIWAGKSYGNAYWVVLLLACTAIFPLSQNIGIEIQRAQNKHQFRSVLYIVMAVINLSLSIYLCQIWGEIGSAIGTAISFIIANTIAMNWFYFKKLGIDIWPYWKNVIRIILAGIPSYMVGAVIIRFVHSQRIIAMLISIMIYTLVYLACMFIFVLDASEKNELTKRICKRQRKLQ